MDPDCQNDSRGAWASPLLGAVTMDDFVDLHMLRWCGRANIARWLRFHAQHRPIWAAFSTFTADRTLAENVRVLRDAGQEAERHMGVEYIYDDSIAVIVWFALLRDNRRLSDLAWAVCCRSGRHGLLTWDGDEARLRLPEVERAVGRGYDGTVETLENLLKDLVPGFVVRGNFERSISFMRWRAAQMQRIVQGST